MLADMLELGEGGANSTAGPARRRPEWAGTSSSPSAPAAIRTEPRQNKHRPYGHELLGNRADAADWSAMVKIDDARLVLANGKTRKTSARKVFAGGDIVRGPALVVEAVQDGKLAARAIGAALAGEVKA